MNVFLDFHCHANMAQGINVEPAKGDDEAEHRGIGLDGSGVESRKTQIIEFAKSLLWTISCQVNISKADDTGPTQARADSGDHADEHSTNNDMESTQKYKP